MEELILNLVATVGNDPVAAAKVVALVTFSRLGGRS
jgi:hypothetical protein